MTSVSLAASEVGESPGPEMIVAIQAMDDTKLVDLAERILVAHREPLAAPPPNEVWPLVNARTSTFTTGGGNRFYARASGAAGLNLVAAMDPGFAGSGRFSTGILRALLYCHGLAIEDPAALGSELYLRTSQDTRPLARRVLEASLLSMVEIHPLLEAGVVQSFFTSSEEVADAAGLRIRMLAELDSPESPFTTDDVWDAFEAGFIGGLQPELAEIWRQVRAGDRHPPLDLIEQATRSTQDLAMIEAFIEVLAELRPRAVVENAVDVVAQTAADIARHGGRHDVLCPSSLYARLLYVGVDQPLDRLRLDELARIDVPGLDQLLTQDAVKIRLESEAFASWRHHLSTGLERARTLRAELGPDSDGTEVVAEEIADARRVLFAEVRRSRTLGRHSGGVLSFVAGALGGAIGAATGTVGGIALGSAGGILPPFLEAVAARTHDTGFLERHYLLFEPKPPA